MQTLKNLLPKKPRVPRGEVLLLDEKTVFYIVRKIIREEYGVRAGENIIPTLYKEKTLFLSSRSSLWANEIWIEREYLRKKMNLLLGEEAITEVKMSRDSL